MLPTDIPTPDTAAARAALEIATEYYSESLLNHCQRAWLWSVGFATEESREFDAELLYVAALLHDIGLVEEFDNHTLAFENGGGHVAIALTAGAGWDAARRTRVHEIIERHMWLSVDPAQDVEGYLLETATALDISGARADALPTDFQRAVLAAHPRLRLAEEFGAHVTDQARRKPGTSSERIVKGGVVRKLADNPLEQLGR
ncbi:HD domain-containing protein [Leifsonia sp. NPDC058292]|uniref:HD domain-containing protein n=1 Tax=Leifsonia sp. NPDC058292 TaxID=3346428 RepID=UPI0036DE58E7